MFSTFFEGIALDVERQICQEICAILDVLSGPRDAVDNTRQIEPREGLS